MVINMEMRDTRLASFAQKRLWLLNQIEAQQGQYNLTFQFWINGRLNVTALDSAMRDVINKHSILNANFYTDGDDVFIKDSEDGSPIVSEVRISDNVDNTLRELESHNFDLENERLIKVTVFKESAQRFLVSFVVHHIVFDGWSMQILFNDVEKAYRSRKAGLPVSQERVSFTYDDYVVNERERITSDEYKALAMQYASIFSDAEFEHNLNLKAPRPITITPESVFIRKQVNRRLSKQVIHFAKTKGKTLYHVTHSIWLSLLSIYTNSVDVISGTPVSGRDRDTEDVIGFFVNSLAMRHHVDLTLPYEELLENLTAQTERMKVFQTIPFQGLVDMLNVPRESNKHPLFQCYFTVNQFNEKQDFFADMPIQTPSQDIEGSLFDIEMVIQNDNGRLTIELLYNPALFEPNFVEDLIDKYSELLAQATKYPKDPLLAMKEVRPALHKKRVSRDTGHILDHYHYMLNADPSETFIVHKGANISRADFDTTVNSYVAGLTALGVRSGEAVAVSLKSTPELICSVFAIWKMGCSLVPFSPDFPESRKALILDAADVRLLISTDEIQHANVVVLNPDDIAAHQEQLSGEPTCHDNVAYIIFTSGTTGEPKGVKLSYSSLFNYIEDMHHDMQTPAGERIFQQSTIGFDIFIDELSLSLLHKGSMLIDEEIKTASIEDYWDLMVTNKVSILSLTPAHWYTLLKEIAPRQVASVVEQFRYFIVGGEAMRPYQINTWFTLMSGSKARLFNVYGPTETTSTSVIIEIQKEHATSIVPIGKPLASETTSIRLENGAIAPIGVVGELYIGGEGVGVDYLNTSAEQHEKFQVVDGERVYRTGDLCYQTHEGLIYFVKRNDSQIKMRGFRIEINEIINAISTLSGVSETVVLPVMDKEGNIQSLSAYVSGSSELVEDQLKIGLGDILPHYMVPQHWFILDALPCNQNGKVDEKSLPVPSLTREVLNETLSEDESFWKSIFQDALGFEDFSKNDRFFDLGGDSLKAMKLIKLASERGVEVDLATIYQAQSPSRLAKKVALSKRRDSSVLDVLTESDADINVICVHPLSGTTECYQGLANGLSDFFNWYGLRSPLLCQTKNMHSIPDIIRHFVKVVIDGALHEKPLVVLGYSLGGALAFDLAAALKRQGCDVIKVVIIDSPPIPFKGEDTSAISLIENVVGSLDGKSNLLSMPNEKAKAEVLEVILDNDEINQFASLSDYKKMVTYLFELSPMLGRHKTTVCHENVVCLVESSEASLQGGFEPFWRKHTSEIHTTSLTYEHEMLLSDEALSDLQALFFNILFEIEDSI